MVAQNAKTCKYIDKDKMIPDLKYMLCMVNGEEARTILNKIMYNLHIGVWDWQQGSE